MYKRQVVHLKAGDGVTNDELRTTTVTFENLACKGGSVDFSNGTAEQVTDVYKRQVWCWG